MTSNRLAYIILHLLLVAILLTPLISWVLSMLGLPCNNLLTDDGFRWFFLRSTSMLMPWWMFHLLSFLVALGCVQYSHLPQYRWHRHTIRQQQGFHTAMLVLSLLVILMLWLVLWPGSPLLSITGGLKHSPFIHGLPIMLALTVILTSLTYGFVSGVLRQWESIPLSLSYGLRQHATWIVDAIFLSLLIQLLGYVA